MSEKHGHVRAILVLLLLQVCFAAVNILYKLAANDGMSSPIVIAYRQLFAAGSITPMALIFERKTRPKLTFMFLVQTFFCALFGGSLLQNLYLESLVLTSATFASAMSNLVPALTFLMAIVFRLEKPTLGTLVGKAKLLGTIVGIGGAMLLTFYKGVEINIWPKTINLLHQTQKVTSHSTGAGQGSHILGSILAVLSAISQALSYIIQTKMALHYPSPYTSAALISCMGSAQATIFALCIERDMSQWKLGWNVRLLTVAYSGIVVSGLCSAAITWSARIKGPVFVSMFSPLMLVIVAFAGSFLLDEKLDLGSILGSALIVTGLYIVLWGKAKETMTEIQDLSIALESDVENGDREGDAQQVDCCCERSFEPTKLDNLYLNREK